MEYADLTNGDLLSDKMKINLHMFVVLVLNDVGGEVHDADVIAVDKIVPRRWMLELMEQLAQLGALSHAVGDDAILGLHAGLRHDHLSLGRSGPQVVPDEHHIPGRRAMSVRTSGPISVGLDDEVKVG
jgi:hypothetical protein